MPGSQTSEVWFEELKRYLHRVLPEYMVPARFGLLAKLPTTMGGKLNRKALPILETHVHEANGHVLGPRDSMEEKLASAFQQILGLSESVSVDDDFFNDLGGDSLLAAQLISKLRDDATTASLTVRCLYEARTVANLAKLVSGERYSKCSPLSTHHRTNTRANVYDAIRKQQLTPASRDQTRKFNAGSGATTCVECKRK